MNNNRNLDFDPLSSNVGYYRSRNSEESKPVNSLEKSTTINEPTASDSKKEADLLPGGSEEQRSD
ncbi:hypothetical protein BH10CYA1_BH10CYA1_42020 [soil metagenome]